jgi:predicted dithiol-disulfide oxidoreductase (DUF899 family)
MRFGRLDEESQEYAKLRDELTRAEIALRDQRERVAKLRRSLPADQEIADERFAEVRDGEAAAVMLSELFENPEQPLLLLHFMYGKAQAHPCPMCTMWADGYDGVVPHLRQRMNFVVLVASDAASFEAYARSRDWRNLRIVSAGESDLKQRLGFETPDGSQFPGASVFVRRVDGSLVHTYSLCAMYAEAEGRGMDLLSPVWNFFDLTPDGRGEFMPSKAYGDTPS